MAKKMTAKLEQYGPRSMPLIRSTHLSDAQWVQEKKNIVTETRRMGRPAEWMSWIKKNLPTCPQCGTDKGPFGSCSGLCTKCGNAARRELDTMFR